MHPVFSLGSPFDFVRDRRSLSFCSIRFVLERRSQVSLRHCHIYLAHVKNNSVVVGVIFSAGRILNNMFKKGNFDSSFNGPIESVDDDNEKDFLFFFCFCFFAHESDSSRSTSSQTKKGRRKKGGDETFFSLGAIINSL